MKRPSGAVLHCNHQPMRTHRHSIRLPGFDYTQAGLYFVTLCCHDRQQRFGHISDGIMHTNAFGRLANDLWYQCLGRFQLPNQHPMQIMPNHLHGIIELPVRNRAGDVGATLAVARSNPVARNDRAGDVGATLAVARSNPVARKDRAGASPAPTIGDVVDAYKSLVAHACLDICRDRRETLGRLWQRNYYEHIIRDESSYSRICIYIESNPMHWQTDHYFGG